MADSFWDTPINEELANTPIEDTDKANWLYPPVKQVDERGFRLPEDQIAKPELNVEALKEQQAMPVSEQMAGFLKPLAKQVGDVALGVPEFIVGGVYNFAVPAVALAKESAQESLDLISAENTNQFYDDFSKFTERWSYPTQTWTGKTLNTAFETAMHVWSNMITEPVVERYISASENFNQKYLEGKIQRQEADLNDLPPEDREIARKLFEEELSNLDLTWSPEIATGLKVMFDAIPQVGLLFLGKNAALNKGKVDAAAYDSFIQSVERGAVRIGADTRSFEDAFGSWFKETRTIDSITGKVSKELTPTKEDWRTGPRVTDDMGWDVPQFKLKPIAKELKTQFTPGKFIAKENELIKWAVDNIDTVSMISDRHLERILFAPDIKVTRGRPKSVPTEQGALYGWKQLKSDTERAKVIEVYYKYDDPKYSEPIPIQHLKTVDGLSDAQVKAYHGLLRGNAQVKGTWNFFGKKYKGENFSPIQGHVNYGHRVWTGDYAIHVRAKHNKKGSPIITLSANTSKGGHTTIEQLKKAMGKTADAYDFAVVPRQYKSTAERSLGAFAEAMVYAERKGLSQEAAAISKIHDEIVATRGFGKHTEKRAGTRGFLGDPYLKKMGVTSEKQMIKDFEQGYIQYITQGIKGSYKMRSDSLMDKFLGSAKIRDSYPSAREFVQDYYNQYMGVPSNLDKALAINDLSLKIGLGETGLQKGQSVLNKIVMHNKLFFHKLTYPVAQFVQPLQVIPAALMELQSMGFKGDISGSVLKSYKSLVFPDKETMQAIRLGVYDKIYAPKFIEQFYSSEFWGQSPNVTSHKLLSKAYWKEFGFDVASGKKTAAVAEEYSRLQAHLMFFHYLRSAGLSVERAAKDGAYMSKMYMVEYTRAEKPRIFTHDATQAFGQFKTYQANYIAQQLEHIKTAKGGDVRPALTFAMSNIMTAGLYGFIGVKAADQVLDSFGYPTLTDMLLETAPDVLMFGPMSAATGIYNPTVGAPQDVGDILSLPASWQWAGKISKYGFTLAKKSASGTATPYDVQNFLKEALPSSMSGYIEKSVNQGSLNPLNQQDYLVHDPKYRFQATSTKDYKDFLINSLGGKTLEEVRTYEAVMQLTRFERGKSESLQSLADYAAFIITKDVVHNLNIPVDVVFDKAVEEYGARPGEFADMVKASFKRQNIELLDRIAVERGRKGKELYLQLLDRIPSLQDEGTNEDFWNTPIGE